MTSITTEDVLKLHPNLKRLHQLIDEMTIMTGEAKILTIKSYVNQAYFRGKINQVNLQYLQQLSRKNIAKERKLL